MDLDPGENGNYYKQKLDLYEGKFELKFDYAPKFNQPLAESSFLVYFNGI